MFCSCSLNIGHNQIKGHFASTWRKAIFFYCNDLSRKDEIFEFAILGNYPQDFLLHVNLFMYLLSIK